MNKSSHWYDAGCSPCHTVVGKNGKPRPSTIRDARELGLFPSVTTVLSILSKPQLDTWKMRQVALAARKHAPSMLGDEDFCEFVIEAAFEQVEEAADLGTGIHKAIEQHFQGLPYDPALKAHVEAVDAWCKTEEVEFQQHELRLVSKSHGYAGTTDAVMKCKRGLGILDFKSRKSVPGRPMSAYEDQVVQIAAYDVAHFSLLPGPERVGVNVFISTTEPGRVEATWYSHAELRDGWQAFEHALGLWRFLKGYDPRMVP